MRAAATKGYEKDYVARIADASRAGENCINVFRCRRFAAAWKKRGLMMVFSTNEAVLVLTAR